MGMMAELWPIRMCPLLSAASCLSSNLFCYSNWRSTNRQESSKGLRPRRCPLRCHSSSLINALFQFPVVGWMAPWVLKSRKRKRSTRRVIRRMRCCNYCLMIINSPRLNSQVLQGQEIQTSILGAGARSLCCLMEAMQPNRMRDQLPRRPRNTAVISL